MAEAEIHILAFSVLSISGINSAACLHPTLALYLRDSQICYITV